jgi:hypothetical protein
MAWGESLRLKWGGELGTYPSYPPQFLLSKITVTNTSSQPIMTFNPATPAGLVNLREYSTGTGAFISRGDVRNHLTDFEEDPYLTNQEVGFGFHRRGFDD